MRPDSASIVATPRNSLVPPAVKAMVDEVCGTFARLFAYVGALALIAMMGLAVWNRLDSEDDPSPTKAGWTVADGATPAFSLRLTDQPDRTATYTVVTHQAGGRKDVLRWGERAERPAAEIEVYRIGPERDGMRNPVGELAARMGRPAPELEAAGIIDSRFGPVTLLRQAGAPDGPGACLGFMKTIAVPALRISGWSCQGVALQTRRAAIGCMLNRLTLLASPAHDAALTDLFTQAEPRRADCDAPAVAKTLNDWITALDNPKLRGTY
ncbi:conserved hypothetical protein [Bradyrhizobium sp. ORS 278]|uniref:hypothetical protein n=1 Tax=Bradyrhizobium sp. (strain ORS 278) TaxID=114615 RepID=UPI0001507E1A|nr:hypothetical protein [Bradyrhizobium sp. ORS 278]CAL74308.1 conserved hypothetical protein [Bradyrhizobium sp. ORS 278]